MALLMALRSGDISRRLVRDVDLDATVLRVYDGKTHKSNRPRKIPEVLQPMLRKLVSRPAALRAAVLDAVHQDGAPHAPVARGGDGALLQRGGRAVCMPRTP
jgi:hypothetical protein